MNYIRKRSFSQIMMDTRVSVARGSSMEAGRPRSRSQAIKEQSKKPVRSNIQNTRLSVSDEFASLKDNGDGKCRRMSVAGNEVAANDSMLIEMDAEAAA